MVPRSLFLESPFRGRKPLRRRICFFIPLYASLIWGSGIPGSGALGIGALVAGQKKMKAHSGKFSLLNIHEDVLNILKLATLDKFFTIVEGEDELL